MISMTFDLDGVIIPLMEHIGIKYNIDLSNQSAYEIRECAELSEEEKHIIIDAFRVVDIYRNAGFYVDMNKLEDKVRSLIARYDIQVCINSFSLDNDVMLYKKEMIAKKMSYVDENEISLIVNDRSSIVKRIENSDFIIEDSINNIYNSIGYKYGLLITQPYNINLKLPSNIIRVNNAIEAVDTIEIILKNNMI